MARIGIGPSTTKPLGSKDGAGHLYRWPALLYDDVMKKPKKQKIKGTPGNYVLNQKFMRFEDRRTKRNRTRREQDRRAIGDYSLA